MIELLLVSRLVDFCEELRLLSLRFWLISGFRYAVFDVRLRTLPSYIIFPFNTGVVAPIIYPKKVHNPSAEQKCEVAIYGWVSQRGLCSLREPHTSCARERKRELSAAAVSRPHVCS